MEKNTLIGNSNFSIAASQNKNIQILVVDDDNRLRTLLMKYLGEQGFKVQAAADGIQMDKVLIKENINLIVLDLMMPGEDGLSICRRLRANGDNTPIIMLTARGEDVDRILGLEMGADDYLAKPFNPRELLARINAILRRKSASNSVTSANHNDENFVSSSGDDSNTKIGNITINLKTNTIHYDNGEEVQLTTSESAILKILLQHPNQKFSRDKLMSLAKGRNQGPFDRAIDVQISRLRKLIEKDPSHPRYLQTVWGFGYIFVPEESQNQA